jgi:hypothetical protein
MVNAACPAVLKTADFPGVSPDHLIIPVAEERRVKINKVNTFRSIVLRISRLSPRMSLFTVNPKSFCAKIRLASFQNWFL